MYRCKMCGEYFDEPVTMLDDPSPIGVGLVAGYYVEKSCPYCGCQDLTEAKQCPVCGEWHTNDGVLCDTCMGDLGVEVDEIRNKLGLPKDDFTDALVTMIERGTI